MATQPTTTGTEEMNDAWSMDNPSIVEETNRKNAASAPTPPFVGGSTPEEGGDATKDANLMGKGTGPLGTDLDLGSGNRKRETGGASIGTPSADDGLRQNEDLANE